MTDFFLPKNYYQLIRINGDLDDSEESNFILLSAVPTDTSQQADDITVINLQKDTKSKQTFQDLSHGAADAIFISMIFHSY